MRKFLLFAMTLYCLSACTPDIDILGDPKDIAVTYALINAGDSAQYFKIYKAFMTSGNAYEVASDLHNISYYDSITVQLSQLNNGSVVRTIVLDTTTSIPKDPGIFANPTQVLYYTDELIDPAYTYELKITNKYTGKVIKAEAQVVPPVVFRFPIEGGRLNIHTTSATVEFNKAQDAIAYDVYLVFKYIEVSKQTGQIVRRGNVRRKLNADFIRNTQNVITYRYVPLLTYELIAAQLKEDPTVIRYRDGYDCLEIEVWAAERNLVTYVDVGKGSSSIIQDKNLYTNFESEDNSAYGVFSSRSKEMASYDMSDKSEDSLVRGSKTEGLGFDYYRNYPGAR